LIVRYLPSTFAPSSGDIMKRIVAAAIAVSALGTLAHAAGPAPAQFFKAKLSGGGTFVEEGNWASTPQEGNTIYNGHSKLTVTLTASEDVQLMLDSGTVTVFAVRPPTSSITASYTSDGTSANNTGTDQGTYDFGGGVSAGAGGGTINIVNDFSPNGDGLSISLGFNEPMSGKCQDSQHGNDCGLNPALQGIPQILGGGNPSPVNGKMTVQGGGGFMSGNSGKPAVINPWSTVWNGLVCHGSMSSGWTCGFSGSRVWQKAPGYTFTQHVQMNAKISIVGNGKW
jgi:hypothetical protein